MLIVDVLLFRLLNNLDHIVTLFAKSNDLLYKETMIVKFLEISKDTGSSEDRVSFVASTETPDRYGDIISVKGWSLEAYKRNPIVILNHDSSSLPIAKGNVHIRNGQLLIDVEFDMDDPLAANVARKAKNGFINAVSVGFQPLESVLRRELDPKNPMYGTKGQYFKRSELLEVSIVTIPANSEATMLGKMKNQDETYLKGFIQDVVNEELQTQVTISKHILNVEETEDSIIVTYAKPKEAMEEREEEIEEDMIEEDEDTEEMGYGDEESSEEDKEKSYFEELSNYIAKLL